MNPFARRKPVANLLCDVNPLGFDGNYSDGVTNWLFPLPGTDRLEEDTFDQLMAMTLEDTNLSWVLFPPGPFRL